MKPWQQAIQWHAENSEMAFEQLLKACLNDGFVWSSPSELCLFAKVKVKDGKLVEGRANAWLIILAAGNKPFKRLMKMAPHPMKYICFHRGDRNSKLHVHEWDNFKRKVK